VRATAEAFPSGVILRTWAMFARQMLPAPSTAIASPSSLATFIDTPLGRTLRTPSPATYRVPALSTAIAPSNPVMALVMVPSGETLRTWSPLAMYKVKRTGTVGPGATPDGTRKFT
jgi:hypothetical protein